MKSKVFSFLLRFLVTGFFLYVIITRVDWSKARDLLIRTDFFYLFLSFAVGVLLVFVSAWKWYILLRARRKELPIGRLFHLYLIGYFFNNILPSNVGGDVIRAYEAGREMEDRPAALASVFVERFTGLTALILLAIISFISNLSLFGDVRFAIALGIAVAGYAFIFAMIAIERPFAYLKSKFEGTRFFKLMSKLVKFQDAIRSYKSHKRTLYHVMGISFLFYLLAVANVYVSSRAFGVEIPVQSLIVIVPVILVISMIPISLGGVGLQEWAYVFTFSAVGAGGSLGILVALLMRFKGISYGLIGGLLYAIKGTGKQTRAELSQKPGGKVEADSLRFHSITMNEKQSPLKKYQMLNLGNTVLWQLLKYEFLMFFVNDLPGLAGLFLRQKLYGSLFGKLGRGVALGRGLVLRQPSKIEIDDNTVIDDYCMLNVRGSEKSGISIGKNVFLGRNTYLNTREGRIEVHDFANLRSNIRVGTAGTVIIGKYAIIAAFCYIGGVNHRIDDLDVPMSMQGSENKGGVVLEEDVWLGANVLINDGVRVGRGSVIGAGSVVTKDIPPYSIAIGSPARVIKDRREIAGKRVDESAGVKEKSI